VHGVGEATTKEPTLGEWNCLDDGWRQPTYNRYPISGR